MASKTKLTPAVQERIVEYLRKGNYVEVAAACSGVHKDSFYEWMKRGAKGEEPFASFADAVHKAMADGEAHDLERIGEAANAQWQAAAWRLERRYPDRYGRHDRVKVDARVDVSSGQLVDKLARLIDGDGEKPAEKKRGRPRKDAT